MDLSVVILKRIKSLIEKEKTKPLNPELKNFISKLEIVLVEEAYNYIVRAEAKMRGKKN